MAGGASAYLNVKPSCALEPELVVERRYTIDLACGKVQMTADDDHGLARGIRPPPALPVKSGSGHPGSHSGSVPE